MHCLGTLLFFFSGYKTQPVCLWPPWGEACAYRGIMDAGPVQWWLGYLFLVCIFLTNAIVTILSLFTCVLNGRTWMKRDEGNVVDPWLVPVHGTLAPPWGVFVAFNVIRLFATGIYYISVAKHIPVLIATTTPKTRPVALRIYPILSMAFALALIMNTANVFVVHYIEQPWMTSLIINIIETFFLLAIVSLVVVQSLSNVRVQGASMRHFPALDIFVKTVYWWFAWAVLWTIETGIRAVIEVEPAVSFPNLQQVVVPVLLVISGILFLFFFAVSYYVAHFGSLATSQYMGGIAAAILLNDPYSPETKATLIIAIVFFGIFVATQAVILVHHNTYSMPSKPPEKVALLPVTTQPQGTPGVRSQSLKSFLKSM